MWERIFWLDILTYIYSRRDNHVFAVVEPAWAIVWQVTCGFGICVAAAMMASPVAFFALLFVGE